MIIAYCGPAALPVDLWTRWNLDPLVIAAIAALALALARDRALSAPAGWAAVTLLLVVFVSPLCALSSALFSARVVHHVLLTSAIAPLLALAFPLRRLQSAPLAAFIGLHAIVFWIWHMPRPYQWGLSTVPAYWLMQASLLGSAWLLWRAVLAERPGPAVLALLATTAQMGFLGALIVFAQRPLFAVHIAGARAWGMTPLSDQQLAGILMWVPASLPWLGAALWLAWRSLRPVRTAA